jgi:hypothetical protein
MNKSLEKIFLKGDVFHKRILAGDQDTKEEILSILIHDEDPQVRYACCNNPNITFDILKSNLANLKYNWIKYSSLSDKKKLELKEIFDCYDQLFI